MRVKICVKYEPFLRFLNAKTETSRYNLKQRPAEIFNH